MLAPLANPPCDQKRHSEKRAANCRDTRDCARIRAPENPRGVRHSVGKGHTREYQPQTCYPLMDRRLKMDQSGDLVHE